MKLVITTNGDKKLLERLDGFPIEWISARLPRDRIGSSTSLPNNIKNMSKENIREYIDRVHSKGLKFNYILDSICLGNIEYTPKGMDEILKMFDWIVDLGIDGVTFSNPLLIRVFKERFPRLKIGSSLSIMWSWIEKRIEYFGNLGVDWIILPTSLNRYLRCLKNLTKRLNCELWLIANSGCLYHCPFVFDHANFLSHLSNYTAPFQYTNYFNLNCKKIILEKPYNLIKSPWIRPEDLCFYEKLGYSTFVIQPNSSQTEEFLEIIRAYSNRKYRGDLMNLLSFMGEKFYTKDDTFPKGLPFINNDKLKDFLVNFPDKNCAEFLCEECRYCIKISKKAVTSFDIKKRKKILQNYEKAIEKI